MPEIIGTISRFNSKGFEVVIQRPMGKLERIRCSYNLWTNIKQHYKIGDIVQVDYTLIGEDEIKVARSFVKREDLKEHFR